MGGIYTMCQGMVKVTIEVSGRTGDRAETRETTELQLRPSHVLSLPLPTQGNDRNRKKDRRRRNGTS